MWKQCSEGQAGSDCATGSPASYSWPEALAHAEAHTFASHADWRLPNHKELRSLVEDCRSHPAINDTRFPNTPSSDFWTGSPYTHYPDYAWSVYFDFGRAYNGYRNSGVKHVRLVRGGQSFDNLGVVGSAAVGFVSENLPDGTFLLGSATKTWTFSNGAAAISGLKAVRVSTAANLGITQTELSIGDVAANAEFVIELPVNPTHTAPAVATSVWKLVDGAGKDVNISNSKSNTFWVKLRTNRPPTFSPLQLSATGGLVGNPLRLKLLGRDADGDTLSYAVVSGDGGMEGDSYVETPTAAGLKSVTLRVSDSMESTERQFDLVVVDGGGLSRFFADIEASSNPNGVYAAATFLASKGIVLGCDALESGQRIFCVDEPVTQAEGLKMLLLAAQARGFVQLVEVSAEVAEGMGNLVVFDEAAGVFSNNSWAAPYALTAASLGMIDDAATWNPRAPVTRADLARWLDRLLDLNVPTALLTAQNKMEVYQFTDAASFADAEAYGQALHSAFFGYLGSLGGTFGPATVLDRGDFALVAARVLRTPTLTGLTYGGTTEAVRFGQTMPVVTHGQTLSITGVQGLDIKEILIAPGEKVLEEWIDPKPEYIRIGLVLSDGRSLGAIRYVSDLAASPYTLDTGGLDLQADSLLTLVVLLESRAPVGADTQRSNVIKAYYLPVAVDFPDRDKDGVRDDLDAWPDDWRFTVDANADAIPDNLAAALTALGLDGSRPATVAGRPAGYTLFEAVLDGKPNDTQGNVLTHTLRALRSGKGSLTLSAEGSSCSGNCTGISGNRPIAKSLADQRGVAALRKGADASGSGAQAVNAGLDCSSGCQVSYVAGSLVQLNPKPATGQVFSHWSGACSGTGACSVAMDADKSVTAHFMPIPLRPSAPARPVASDGTRLDAVDIRWSAVSRASRYQVFRCWDTNPGSCGILGETAATLYEHMVFEPGSGYFYRVQACNAGGCSGLSPADAGWRGVGSVSWLTASRDRSSNVYLEWGEPSDEGGFPLEYRVYRGEGESGPWTLLDSHEMRHGDQFFLDQTVRNGRTYWYRVQACSLGGRCGEMSQSVSGGGLTQGHALGAGPHLRPFLAEVVGAHAGMELVTPLVQDLDGGIRFSFQARAVGQSTLLSSTPPAELRKPVCAGGVAVRERESWRFLHRGYYLVAGASYRVDCSDGVPASQSYVYIVDVAHGTSRLYSHPGWQLAGLNLTGDHDDSGGGDDLMVTLVVPETGTQRVDLLNFTTETAYGGALVPATGVFE